jgi:pilus assembly protein CpaB
MNRNTRMLIVVGIAVLTASLASVGLFFALRQPPPPPKEYVVVAARPLELGTILTPDMVRAVVWPAESRIAGTHAKVEELVDRGVVTPVAEGEPITESKLAPKDAGGGLTIGIEKGMRAMSVKVNEVVGVAGFVVPGTKVDVLVTIRQGQTTTTLNVVNNVTVLTAGTRYDAENAKKEGKAISSSVVTLMLTPDDTARIVLASNEGQLMLALRNPLEVDSKSPGPVRTPDLFRVSILPPAEAPPAAVPVANRPPVRRAPRVVLAPPPPSPPPPPPRKQIEIIRAGVKSMETIS